MADSYNFEKIKEQLEAFRAEFHAPAKSSQTKAQTLDAGSQTKAQTLDVVIQTKDQIPDASSQTEVQAPDAGSQTEVQKTPRSRLLAALEVRKKNNKKEKKKKSSIRSALKTASLYVYPPSNFDPGRNEHTEDDINISEYECFLINLMAQEGCLNEKDLVNTYPDLFKYIPTRISLIKYNKDYRAKIATAFGLVTERRDRDATFITKMDLLKNFANVKDGASLWRNIPFGIFFSILNTIRVLSTVFMSAVKLFTEFLFLGISEYANNVAKKLDDKLKRTNDLSTQCLLWPAYITAKSMFVLFRVFYFIGRAITSAPAGTLAAAREGRDLGGKGTLGTVLATVFVIASLLVTVAAIIFVLPIKAAISYYKTVIPMVDIMPHALQALITKVSNIFAPFLSAIGNTIGGIFMPAAGPFAVAVHEPLTHEALGLGTFFGMASVVFDTAMTVFGLNYLKMGVTSLFNFGMKIFKKPELKPVPVLQMEELPEEEVVRQPQSSALIERALQRGAGPLGEVLELLKPATSTPLTQLSIFKEDVNETPNNEAERTSVPSQSPAILSKP